MTEHNFIFKPQLWLGEGNISLSGVEEELHFFTRWKLDPTDNSGLIGGMQEIQIKGLSDMMLNQFTFSDVTDNSFKIELENDALGHITGKGVIDNKVIGWEFRIKDIGFDGFEFYELQPDGSYHMRAEYSTADQFRTTIKGKVWPKEPQKS